jgi:aspartyl-tRNA(Asn)/glutamyl-tRNA(Gln) amidotransferase subunit C
MIIKDEIKKLADLARIDVSDEEVEGLTSQIDSILDYVGQIQNSTGDAKAEVPKLRNVMRDDVVTNNTDEYTEKLLNNAPSREGRYLKVKKIL